MSTVNFVRVLFFGDDSPEMPLLASFTPLPEGLLLFFIFDYQGASSSAMI
jgi:hypothetical protein